MKTLTSFDARVKLACLAIYIVATLHARAPLAVAACVALAIALACIVRISSRDVRAIMLPLAPILIVTAIMQVLYFQQGLVVASIGPIAITAEALYASVRMVACLLAIMLASVSFMRCTTTEELMCMLRWLLSPLRALGLRTEAFMLSLSVAFRFVPVLVDEFQLIKRAQLARGSSFEGKARERLGAYTRLFAPLIRSSFNRADTLAEAFLARCFSCGTTPTSLHAGSFGVRELICLACTIAISAIVIALG